MKIQHIIQDSFIIDEWKSSSSLGNGVQQPAYLSSYISKNLVILGNYRSFSDDLSTAIFKIFSDKKNSVLSPTRAKMNFASPLIPRWCTLLALFFQTCHTATERCSFNSRLVACLSANNYASVNGWAAVESEPSLCISGLAPLLLLCSTSPPVQQGIPN